jgi:hypothetical protein
MALVVIANTTMPTSVKSTVSNLHAISFPESESVGCDGKHNRGRHWPKVQLQESARRVRNEEQPVPLSRLCCTYLTRNGLQRCGPFVMLANMMGSLNQFVLVSARKSRGGEWWSA